MSYSQRFRITPKGPNQHPPRFPSLRAVVPGTQRFRSVISSAALARMPGATRCVIDDKPVQQIGENQYRVAVVLKKTDQSPSSTSAPSSASDPRENQSLALSSYDPRRTSFSVSSRGPEGRTPIRPSPYARFAKPGHTPQHRMISVSPAELDKWKEELVKLNLCEIVFNLTGRCSFNNNYVYELPQPVRASQARLRQLITSWYAQHGDMKMADLYKFTPLLGVETPVRSDNTNTNAEKQKQVSTNAPQPSSSQAGPNMNNQDGQGHGHGHGREFV